MEQNIEKIEGFIAHTIPRLGERSGDSRGDARHLFLAGYMADSGLSGRGAVELRPAILHFMGRRHGEFMRIYYDAQEKMSASAVQYVRECPW